MKTIIHVLNINQNIDRVFESISTKKGLSGWWSTEVTLKKAQDEIVDFTFRDEFNPNMKIVKKDRPNFLEWVCISGHIPWKDNRFLFELSKNKGVTQLKFTQEYAVELNDEQYGIYNFNWGYYLYSLKLYCETNKGKPFNPKTM